MYKNADINNALIVVFEQMKVYFSACINDKNRMPAIENAISKHMLPRIEAYIVDDIMAGGEHTFKTIENKGQPILLIDDVAFCNYTASEGWGLLQKYDCPLSKDYHLINEGKKTADIINDFCSMDVKEFAKKHYVPVEFKNTDVLIKHITSLYDTNNFSPNAIREKVTTGTIRFDDRMKAAVLQYCNANPNYLRASYENGVFTLNDSKTEGRIEATVGFGRDDTTSDFELRCLYIDVYHSKDESDTTVSSFKVKIPDDCKKELGKIFTKTTYPRLIGNDKKSKGLERD